MASEEKYANSGIITIRLGLGSIVFAAVITFVGLAWIFFLGVMVGRMYYGVDASQKSQTNIISQHNVEKNVGPWDAEQATGKNENPAQGKSRTTYHPVIKEDHIAERVSQSPDAFPHDDSVDTNIAARPASENTEPVTIENTATPIPTDTLNEEITPESTPELSEVQDSDFIEKVHDIDANHNSKTNIEIENHHTDIQSPENSTNTEDIEDNESIIASQEGADTNVHPESMEILPVSKTDTEEFYDYTYQVATFKNPDNARVLNETLSAEGLKVSSLSEERNGELFHYVLVHHQGTESSKEAVEKILINNNFTTFIMRSKRVQ